jgi:hypothetical protein
MTKLEVLELLYDLIVHARILYTDTTSHGELVSNIVRELRNLGAARE